MIGSKKRGKTMKKPYKTKRKGKQAVAKKRKGRGLMRRPTFKVRLNKRG